MKILYITQILPYPLDSGGKIKTYQTLKVLSKKHQIWLVCFVSKPLQPSIKKKIKQVCHQVRVVISPYSTAQFKEIKPFIFKSLFSPLPFMVCRYRDKKMKNLVKELIEQEKFDAIHIDHLNMAFYLPKKKSCLYVLDEHNIETELNWQIFCQEKLNKFKIFSFLEWGKTKIYERKMIPRFDYWLAISREDKEKLVTLMAGREKTFVSPTPFKPYSLFKFNRNKPLILFVGSLDWWPNKEGIAWFIWEIFPLVLKEIPSARLIVIGNRPHDNIIQSAKGKKNIKITGYVKNLTYWWRKTRVFIVPLHAGTGIRIKILTALSKGIPVVSTSIGAEGIDFKNNKDLLIGNTPYKFAQQVIKILKDQELADLLSQNGLKLIRKRYSHAWSAKVLAKIYG